VRIAKKESPQSALVAAPPLMSCSNLLLETCPVADYIPDMKPAALKAGIPSLRTSAVSPGNLRPSLSSITFYVSRFPFSS